MATVKIEQLRKTYGGIVAVDGMDLEVAAGSIHTVVGENGAGKSTLVQVLAGAVRPDSGTITLDGQVVEFASARAARAHGISIVYQELGVLPERPVLANLFIFFCRRLDYSYGLLQTLAKIEANVVEAAAQGIDIVAFGEEALIGPTGCDACRVGGGGVRVPPGTGADGARPGHRPRRRPGP